MFRPTIPLLFFVGIANLCADIEILREGENPAPASIPAEEPCPDWLKPESAPLCPEKSAPLDTSFPDMAHVVSDTDWTTAKNLPADQIFASNQGYRTTSHYVLSVLASHADKPPFIFFKGSKSNYEAIVAGLKSFLESPAGAAAKPYAERWLHAVKHVGSSSYQWNQDFMEPTFAEKTGGPVANFYGYYNDIRPTGASEVAEASRRYLAQCGFVDNPKPYLNKVPPKGAVNAYMGGNIEGMPEGYCLVGNNVEKEQLSTVCPPEKVVQIETDWLTVGHVDEIVNFVPLAQPAAGTCKTAIMLASPRLALELIRKNPDEQLFSGFYSGKHSLTRERNLGVHGYQEMEQLIDRPNSFMQQLCDIKIELDKLEKNKPTRKSKGKQKEHSFWQNIFALPIAEARISIELNRGKACEPINLTGRDFLRAMDARPEIKESLDTIQASLDRSRATLYRHFKKQYKCEPKIVELPSLYSTAAPRATGKAHKAHPQKQLYALSAFPNPTNGVFSNGTFIGNHSINPLFAENIEGAFNSLGVNSEYIFTYTGPHAQQGNVHCSTQVMRYCKPRPAITP